MEGRKTLVHRTGRDPAEPRPLSCLLQRRTDPSGYRLDGRTPAQAMMEARTVGVTGVYHGVLHEILRRNQEHQNGAGGSGGKILDFLGRFDSRSNSGQCSDRFDSRSNSRRDVPFEQRLLIPFSHEGSCWRSPFAGGDLGAGAGARGSTSVNVAHLLSKSLLWLLAPRAPNSRLDRGDVPASSQRSGTTSSSAPLGCSEPSLTSDHDRQGSA